MSFDVYVQFFDGGKESGLSLQRLRAAFGTPLVELEDDYWQVRYDDAESSDLFLQPVAHDPHLIHTVCVHRPCRNPLLWQAIYTLLEEPAALFHFPGCAAPLTRNVAAVPTEILAALGTPLQVNDAAQLRQAVDSLQV